MNGNMKILGLLLLMGLAFAAPRPPEYVVNQYVRAECLMNYSGLLTEVPFEEDLNDTYADMEDSMDALTGYYEEQDFASFNSEFQNLIQLHNQLKMEFLKYGFLFLLEGDTDPDLIFSIFAMLQGDLNDCFITGEFSSPVPP